MILLVILLCSTLWLALSPYRANPLHLPDRQPKSAIQFDRSKYPNGRFLPAIDPLTGASVIEVDVNTWDVVRALELDIYNFYWHTRAGECLSAGITPEEEAEQRRARAPRPLTAAERNHQPVVSPHGWWEMKMAQMDDLDAMSGDIARIANSLAARGIVS